MASDAAESRCWLCHRPLGARVEWHHPLPRAKGGRSVVALHPICHRAIHANFSNAQLARIGADRDTLLANTDLAVFLAWVAGKPPDFHAPTRSKKR
ncbi:HNH endonuclease [Sandarakinorhabdus cyanobacteriorum]|uniref:HNH endonuclease n=1 Tax=Sandarakinorhabdus cyanobacteriorum TaxID=1981098 RepID=A0A255Y761_9SPHN|nr:HNH endonuclease [Sandarakinorhabdus cyanobacteriorum]OYQ25059.1 HNH endonuclease [Sandarakinorhabdus cyanobacteriorum]